MTRICATCGKTIERPIANQQYCGDPCLAPSRSGSGSTEHNTPRHLLDPDYEYSKISTWRKHVLRASAHACADCGATDGVLHAHHIVPTSQGGKNVVSNGKVLCEECHRKLHDPYAELVERITDLVLKRLAEKGVA